jgi:glutaredoxin-like protein NrdH
MAITVYTKPSCVQCTATYRALDNKGIEYDDHWSGFRPDKIAGLAARVS